MAWNPGVGRDKRGYQKSHPSHGGGGGGGDGPPSVVHKPKGPTAAEIAAAKAAAEAKKKAAELKAHKKYKHGKFIPGSICVRGTGTTNLFEFFPYVKWAKTVKTNSQARLNSLFLLPYCTRLTYKDIHGKWIREI